MRERKDRRRTHQMNPDTIFPPSEAEYSITGDAIRQEDIEQGGIGNSPGPKEGMRRYPTESPGKEESEA